MSSRPLIVHNCYVHRKQNNIKHQMIRVNVQTQCAGSPCVPHIQVYIMARSQIFRVVRGGFTPYVILNSKMSFRSSLRALSCNCVDT